MENRSVFSLKDFKDLSRVRDELKLQTHLLKAGLAEKFHGLEKDWEKLSSHMNEVTATTQQASKEVSDATQLLAQTVREGYQKIKDSLTA